MLSILEGVDTVDHVVGGQALELAAVPLNLGSDSLRIAVCTSNLTLGRTPPNQSGLDRLSSIDHDPTVRPDHQMS